MMLGQSKRVFHEISEKTPVLFCSISILTPNIEIIGNISFVYGYVRVAFKFDGNVLDKSRDMPRLYPCHL